MFPYSGFYGEHAYSFYLLKSNVSLRNYFKPTSCMEPFLKLKLSVLSASLKCAHLFLLSNVFLTVFCLLSIQSTLVSNSLFSGCFDGVGGKGRSISHVFCPRDSVEPNSTASHRH